MNDLFEGPEVSELAQPDMVLSRSEKRALREERKRAAKRRRRALLSVLVAIVVVGAGGYFVWDRGVAFFASLDGIGGGETQEILDFPGPGTGEVQVVVEAGATGSQIGQALTEAGVVASSKGFVAAFNANPSAGSIQPGTYNLFKEMKSADAIAALLDPASRADFVFDIPPGFNAAKTTARISKVTGIPEAEITAAIADPVALGLPAEAGGNIEGWLWADRYEFGLDVTPAQMFAEMITRTVAKLDELGVAAENRMTVLTKASIVEKESGGADRPTVASVINNRLAKPMKLEMDSTVHYLFGASADATTTAEQRATDSPYNTYRYEGLPPAPIASPSTESISAVLTPAVTNYFFFVTVNPLTGETKFAATFPEHQKNVKLYQEWLAENGTQ